MDRRPSTSKHSATRSVVGTNQTHPETTQITYLVKKTNSDASLSRLCTQESEKAHNLECINANSVNRVNSAILVSGVNSVSHANGVNGVSHTNGIKRSDVNANADVNANSDTNKSKGGLEDAKESPREVPKAFVFDLVDHPHEKMGVGIWKNSFYRSKHMSGGGGGGGVGEAGGGGGEKDSGGEDGSKQEGGGEGGMNYPLGLMVLLFSGAGFFALGSWSTKVNIRGILDSFRNFLRIGFFLCQS